MCDLRKGFEEWDCLPFCVHEDRQCDMCEKAFVAGFEYSQTRLPPARPAPTQMALESRNAEAWQSSPNTQSDAITLWKEWSAAATNGHGEQWLFENDKRINAVLA